MKNHYQDDKSFEMVVSTLKNKLFGAVVYEPYTGLLQAVLILHVKQKFIMDLQLKIKRHL